MFCVEHIGFGVEQQGWVETNSGKTGSLDQLPNKAVVSRKDVATDWTVVETKIKTNKNKTSQELQKLPYTSYLESIPQICVSCLGSVAGVIWGNSIWFILQNMVIWYNFMLKAVKRYSQKVEWYNNLQKIFSDATKSRKKVWCIISQRNDDLVQQFLF